jgi:hypothetical protein
MPVEGRPAAVVGVPAAVVPPAAGVEVVAADVGVPALVVGVVAATVGVSSPPSVEGVLLALMVKRTSARATAGTPTSMSQIRGIMGVSFLRGLKVW